MSDKAIETPSSLERKIQGSGAMYSKLPVSIKPLILKLVNNLHTWWFVSRDTQQFLLQSYVLTQTEMNQDMGRKEHSLLRVCPLTV